MFKTIIKETQNPTIIKFETPEFIVNKGNYEFKNIDEAQASPLAQKLFYLPFVKSVYISGNFIAVERFSIVEWTDVQEDVQKQIEDFVNNGGKIIIENHDTPNQKIATTVYGETTPNPAVLKFVANRMLTKNAVEFKNIDEALHAPLVSELFKFPYVKEVFVDENYISVTKYDAYDWNAISMEMRTFIKNYFENGGIVVDEHYFTENPEKEEITDEAYKNLDDTSQRIIAILDEYVKPAVQSDGGNISFVSYDAMSKRVTVTLKGACSGCPSSTFTLKNGIENMLKQMLNDEQIMVEALNG